MPPVTNNSLAQEPKKPGFFARLFGKKKETPVVSPASSFTPPPQLTDRPGSVTSNDTGDVSAEKVATPLSTEPVANTANQTGVDSTATTSPVGAPDGSLPSDPNTTPSTEAYSVPDVQTSENTVADNAPDASPNSDNPVSKAEDTGPVSSATNASDENSQQASSDQTVSLPK